MTEVEIESDAFLTLLTDALRAGPGSPAWHEAVNRLRAGGIEHADEHQLLLTAREHLESGKEYRSVRAGPGFTQRLLMSIDEQAKSPPRTPPTATTMALASAALMLIVLGVIGYLLSTASDRSPNGAPPLLANTVASFNAATGILPPEWQKVGRLGLELSRNAIRPAGADEPGASGGAVYWRQAIDPDEPFAVQVNLRLSRFTDDLIPQVFVTDDPRFSEDNGTTGHELVWLLQGSRARVITPDHKIEAQSDLTITPPRGLQVRVTVDRDTALVELGSERFWSGPNELDPKKPRYVGVRFLRRSGGAAVNDAVYFQNLRILMRPQ